MWWSVTLFAFDGAEGADPDVEGEEVVGKGGEDFGGEVKAGGGGGDGSFFFGKGGLVAGVVELFGVALHVVGQGEGAELGVGHLVPVDEAVAVFIDFGDGSGGVLRFARCGRPSFFCRPHEGAPAGVGDFLDAKEFDFLVVGKEACGNNLGVVEDEEVILRSHSRENRRKCLCSMVPVSRWTTSMREAARSSRGWEAMSSSGRW